MFNFSLEQMLSVITIFTLLAPLFTLCLMISAAAIGIHLKENQLYKIIEATLGTNFILSPVILILFLSTGLHSFEVSFGRIMTVGSYHFDFSLIIDRLNIPLIFLANLLIGIVGRFSMRYLHRENGHRRFFALLLLFDFGILMTLMSGTIDILFAGWELVGIASTLLVCFFQYRPWPVKNAFYTFVTYKICDVSLLSAAIYMHSFTHTASFSQAFKSVQWPNGHAVMNWESTTLVAALIMIASMGKAAQLPFTSWLPKAMEGPTPSSAIFYGALSSHLGPFLLLRMYPLFAHNSTINAALITIGTLTALYASGVGRTRSDIKATLSYATITQISLVYIEIGLGLPYIALIHLVGHACLRTLQFLRSPSIIQDYHRLHNLEGAHFHAPGAYFEQLLPLSFRTWLYYHANREFYLDVIIEKFIFVPVLFIAKTAGKCEAAWIKLIAGTDKEH